MYGLNFKWSGTYSTANCFDVKYKRKQGQSSRVWSINYILGSIWVDGEDFYVRFLSRFRFHSDLPISGNRYCLNPWWFFLFGRLRTPFKLPSKREPGRQQQPGTVSQFLLICPPHAADSWQGPANIKNQLQEAKQKELDKSMVASVDDCRIDMATQLILPSGGALRMFQKEAPTSSRSPCWIWWFWHILYPMNFLIG